MSARREITIVGGGLAGLSLGVSLARRGVPVRVLEAGAYPRHKVCGEFISGRAPEFFEYLGLEFLTRQVRPLRETRWYFRDKPVLNRSLPRPALGISRHRLDLLLAERFIEEGGNLETGTRWRGDPEEGVVVAAGRRVEESDWLGLKCHCKDLPLETDLELFLGRDGYAGASPVEDGWFNVCGLFRRRPEVRAARKQLLPAYLRACGINLLAGKVEAAEIAPGSSVGVSAIDFGRRSAKSGELRLGDSFSVTPPFTGNGMSMAFEAAALATEPLLTYAKGERTWSECAATVAVHLDRAFTWRLAISSALHPLLVGRASQAGLAGMGKIGVLPFGLFYKLTH